MKPYTLVIGNRPAFEVYLNEARRLGVDTTQFKWVRDESSLWGYDIETTHVHIIYGYNLDLVTAARSRYLPENIRHVDT